MFWLLPDTWTPHDEAELVAGWRLWLELSDRAWPTASWDGTPSGAVGPLRELLDACEEIESTCRETAEPSAEFTDIVQPLVLCASAVLCLWWDDHAPLDSTRAKALHEDLRRFSTLAERVLTLLSAHGGWTELDVARRHPA